ncbi:MAG: hypothetical protein AAF604_16430 [Acidobacteriota bacterium]
MLLRKTAPRKILNVLAVVILFCSPTVTATEADIPWVDVLYYGEESSKILWVSHSLIMGNPRQNDHGLAKTEIENLAYSLKSWSKDFTDCKYAMSITDLRRMRSFDVVSAFANNQFSGRGVVRARELGWHPFLARVETLLYIQLEEVFRDVSGRLQPGDYVLWTEPVGRIELDDGYLCTIKPGSLGTPSTGDEVAFVGRPREPEAEFPVIDGFVFMPYRIENETIEAVPYPLPGTPAMTLHELRAALADRSHP